MRRVQVHIGEELDDAAASEAARRGISKAALIREGLARVVEPRPVPDDPWEALVGWLDDDPVDDVDDVVYGLSS